MKFDKFIKSLKIAKPHVDQIIISLPRKYWFVCPFELYIGFDEKDTLRLTVKPFSEAVKEISGLSDFDRNSGQFEGQSFTVDVAKWNPKSETRLLKVVEKYKKMAYGDKKHWCEEIS